MTLPQLVVSRLRDSNSNRAPGYEACRAKNSSHEGSVADAGAK